MTLPKSRIEELLKVFHLTGAMDAHAYVALCDLALQALQDKQKFGAYSREELRELLYAVVNELNLSDSMLEKHGPHGTEPHLLVREVLEHKDRQIKMLQAGFKDIGQSQRDAEDARRYRWLRDNAEDYDGCACFPEAVYPAPIPDVTPFNKIDAAIDAAISAQGGES